MKFYIFGSDKKEFSALAKSRINNNSCINLDEALKLFEKYVEMVYDDNLYLIADFESEKKPFIASLSEDRNPILPYIILCEWHLTGDPEDDIIRKDHLQIHRRGFIQSFENNVSAIRAFLECAERLEECSLHVTYYKKMEKATAKFTRKIADQNYRKCEGKYPLRIIKFTDLKWILVPIERGRAKFFSIVKPKPEEGYDFNIEEKAVNGVC